MNNPTPSNAIRLEMWIALTTMVSVSVFGLFLTFAEHWGFIFIPAGVLAGALFGHDLAKRSQPRVTLFDADQQHVSEWRRQAVDMAERLTLKLDYQDGDAPRVNGLLFIAAVQSGELGFIHEIQPGRLIYQPEIDKLVMYDAESIEWVLAMWRAGDRVAEHMNVRLLLSDDDMEYKLLSVLNVMRRVAPE